jgi:hypothetical protein
MFVRVMEAGKPGFQLRKGELGLSVFDTEAVDPPLSELEIVEAFRPESQLVFRSREAIDMHGLTIVRVPGDGLPPRLCDAHAEIRPGSEMTRAQFKKALQELE